MKKLEMNHKLTKSCVTTHLTIIVSSLRLTESPKYGS